MLDYILILLVLCLGTVLAYFVYERYYAKTKQAESTLYVAALKDLVDGKQEAAFTKLRQVVAADANNIDAYLRLGQILREHNKPDRALQVHKDLTLRGGLSRDEKLAVLHQLTLDYHDLEEWQTAAQALNEMITLDPKNHWAHTRLLKLHEQAQNWDDAYETAVTVLKLESNKSKKPLALYKYKAGVKLYKTREYHKARVILKEAIGLDPTFVNAYLTIGDSYYAEKRFEDAVTYWEKLIGAVPRQGHLVISRLQKTLFELGRFGDIMEICQNILEHDPKNLEARRTLAEFYEKKGELDQAIEILENVIDDHPEDTSTLLELVQYYLEKGDRKKLGVLLHNVEKKREARKSAAPEKTVDSVPSSL